MYSAPTREALVTSRSIPADWSVRARVGAVVLLHRRIPPLPLFIAALRSARNGLAAVGGIVIKPGLQLLGRERRVAGQNRLRRIAFLVRPDNFFQRHPSFANPHNASLIQPDH